MARQNNYGYPMYHPMSTSNLRSYKPNSLPNMSNVSVVPIIQDVNQTNVLKSVHGENISSWVAINNTNHTTNKYLAPQTHDTTNSSLNILKQEHTTYVLPTSLNIWLTHGLLFGAFILLLILCTLIVVEKIDTIQRAFFIRRKVQRWDEEKLGGIFSIYNNNKVLAANNNFCCHEENNISLNDVISTSGEKYKVSERKIGQVTNPSTLYNQSMPPNCPMNDEMICGQKEFSHSHSYPVKFSSQFNGTDYDGVLRKRSNENKSSNSFNCEFENTRTRSKSYLY